MKPNFKNIDIYAGFHPQNGMEWQKANDIKANWRTPEQIQVKPVYTKEDLEGMEHLNSVCRYSSLPERSVLDDVYVPSVDYPPVCRFSTAEEIKCILSP